MNLFPQKISSKYDNFLVDSFFFMKKKLKTEIKCIKRKLSYSVKCLLSQGKISKKRRC